MVSCLLAGVAWAEQKTTQKHGDIVVTAMKTSKRLENVPAVVTVISPDEIDATPARTHRGGSSG